MNGPTSLDLATRRLTLLRRLAWLCAALVLAITSLSAYLRLSKAGVGCEPWPQCRELVAEGVRASEPAVETAARLAHRVTAVLALFVVIAMLMLAFGRFPVLRAEGELVMALLVLALFLAVLGRWTAGARVPAVTLGNLLAGFAMLAVAVCLASRTGRAAGDEAPTHVQGWARLAVLILVIDIAVGGLVSATHSGRSCPRLLPCDVAQANWEVFNPWRQPPAVPIAADGALLQLVHRLGALVVAALVLPLGALAWRGGRRVGAVAIGLVLAQSALGVLMVMRALPFEAAWAHNVLAALLLAVLTSLVVERKGLR